MTYDETFAGAMDRLRNEIEALPWYTWPFKVRLRWKLRALEALVASTRDEALRQQGWID